jgi:tetratricopeptide (TPR) repeat protein
VRRDLAAAGLLLAAALPVRAGAEMSELSSGYREAVRRYAAGERDAALDAVASLPERQLKQQLAALTALARRARACTAACDAIVAWREVLPVAAAMLHTDASLQARARATTAARLQETTATAIVELLRDEPERRGFVERWHVAMAGVAAADARWNDAQVWAERGLQALPGSAELALALGAVLETRATLEAPRWPQLTGATAQQRTANQNRFLLTRERLERARRALVAALAAAPSLDEARLRLGRVQWRLGEAAEAKATFEQVAARTAAHDVVYLARVFSGRIAEDGGRFDEAVRAYEAAIALDGEDQAAYVALSQALLRLGDSIGARRAVEASLAPAGRRSHSDPFWNYGWGPGARISDRLEGLRREASR